MLSEAEWKNLTYLIEHSTPLHPKWSIGVLVVCLIVNIWPFKQLVLGFLMMQTRGAKGSGLATQLGFTAKEGDTV